LDRYSLFIPCGDSKRFLAAVYDLTSSGILLTDVEEDACSYVTMDKAVAVARELKSLHGYDVGISVTADA
jgi:hypothetical protein